eukprot:GHVU01023387.1.p3 GENE.GHVU01023387.1~~GHVU01023387.1.p3  ORF type:complete len:101 (-),score=10.01 GHVU01023387.1:125-427(-)
MDDKSGMSIGAGGEFMPIHDNEYISVLDLYTDKFYTEAMAWEIHYVTFGLLTKALAEGNDGTSKQDIAMGSRDHSSSCVSAQSLPLPATLNVVADPSTHR